MAKYDANKLIQKPSESDTHRCNGEKEREREKTNKSREITCVTWNGYFKAMP